MTGFAWVLLHLIAVAVLTGVGWVVQVVVYPAFALVGPAEWGGYHARHTRMITRVVGLPWLVQGVTTAGLLVVGSGRLRLVAVALAVLALVTVAATVVAAVPAHGRLAGDRERVAADLPGLLRANLVRTLAWTAATALAAAALAWA